VIWLAIKDASKKWTMPIQNWKLAMNQFMIDFGDRLDDHRFITASTSLMQRIFLYRFAKN
ncbi:hypothetical protein Q7497_04115, partial [Glaesserella parasuis]|nr:hypothetical protein [Glaesserella parasuis]MDO9820445.1 hypothetical protein [Glaesserella parasuis]